MLPALEKFEEELSSLNHKEYVYYKKVTSSIKKKATDLIKNESKNLKEIDSNNYKFRSKSKKVYKIVYDPDCYECPDCTFCTCSSFLDKAVCKHLTMICIKNKYSLPGLTYLPKFSLRKAQRKGRFSKASPALDISN